MSASGYRFCHLLGYGGMGEVYLAVQYGYGDFQKLVVIKRMFPHHRHDDELTALFANEARLAAGIRHPDVVQVLDIRQDERELFIVMEYLPGPTVRDVIDRATERTSPVPLGIVARICADAAAGVHAAHTATVRGKPQQIIHQDVSPSNVLAGYDGVVKVLDFGIARIAEDRRKRDTGAIRGKAHYMSPERRLGEAAGPTSDVYELGVVLYELLTGHNPHSEQADRGSGEERTFRPASELRADIPDSVNEILERALHADPARRTASAETLRRELLAMMDEEGVTTSADDVAVYVDEVFADEKAERQKLERDAASGALDRGEYSYLDRVMTGSRARTMPGVVISKPPRRTWTVAAALTTVTAGLVFAVWPSEPPSEPAPKPEIADAPSTPQPLPTFELKLDVSPTQATIHLDGAEVATGTYTTTMPADGSFHLLEIAAEGFHNQVFRFRDDPPPQRVELVPVAPDQPAPRPITRPTPAPATAEPVPEPAGPVLPTTDNIDPWSSP